MIRFSLPSIGLIQICNILVLLLLDGGHSSMLYPHLPLGISSALMLNSSRAVTATGRHRHRSAMGCQFAHSASDASMTPALAPSCPISSAAGP